MSDFPDHFSKQAEIYRRFRPSYPDALFDWLAEVSPGHACALDAGTGNGQAAVALTAHFERVVAADPSAAQIERAEAHPRVTYHVAPAERLPVPDASAELVAVAQALHWFDFPRFFDEVRRVLVPGGVMAAFGYSFFHVSPEVDAVIEAHLLDRLAPDWPPQNRLLWEGYRGCEFPPNFVELPAPVLVLEPTMTRDALLGYAETWSAWQRHTERTGVSPRAGLEAALAPLWPEDAVRTIRMPLILRAFRLG